MNLASTRRTPASRLEAQSASKLRIGSRLGKYRLTKRIGSGGFADVFAASDSILGISVALKIPNSQWVTESMLDDFRREVRLTLKLEHPNIMPIRDASFIDGHFVIVSPLGKRTLDDRLQKRVSFENAFGLASQLICAVAHAHELGIIHCDIKPENILLFDDDHVRLGDFGIAKVSQKTISGSGTGTIGFMAPEQAMGRPSARSDVFSLGLIVYRLFAGVWPEYPFEWPMEGSAKLKQRAHPDLIKLIRKSLEVRSKDRFPDANSMLREWKRCKSKSLKFANRHRGS